MNIQAFKSAAKAAGLRTRKQRDLEVFDVGKLPDVWWFSATYADIFHVQDIRALFEVRGIAHLYPQGKESYG